MSARRQRTARPARSGTGKAPLASNAQTWRPLTRNSRATSLTVIMSIFELLKPLDAVRQGIRCRWVPHASSGFKRVQET